MAYKLPTSPRYRKSAKALFLREKSIRAKNPTLLSAVAAINPEDRKLKEYARQLREKQKVRRLYGVNEGQFSRYYKKASKAENTAEQMLLLLERRLDNVVYRAGFANTRAQSRQFVTHGLFTVNGHRVDIPSYTVSVNDVIAARKPALFEDKAYDMVAPWIELDKKKHIAKVNQLPTRDDIDADINEQLIVEFYSR